MTDDKESFKLQLKLSDRTTPIIICGFLKKQGGSIRSWKKRWFILQNNSLKYYEATEKKTVLKGEIILNEQHVARDGDSKSGKQYSIELYHPTMRSYYFYGNNQKEKETWITSLNDYLTEMKKDGEKNIQEIGIILKGLMSQDPEIQIKSINSIVEIFSHPEADNNLEKKNQFWQTGGLKAIMAMIDSKCPSNVLSKAMQLMFWLSQYENVKTQLLELGIMKTVESLLEKGLLQIRAAVYLLLHFVDDPNGNPKFAVKCCTKMMSLQITNKLYQILERRSVPPEITSLLLGCLANCSSYMQLRATMIPFPNLIQLSTQNISSSKDFPTVYHSVRLLANLSSDQVWRDKIMNKDKDVLFEDLYSVLLTFRGTTETQNIMVQKTVVQTISNLSLHPEVLKSLLNSQSGSFNTLISLAKEKGTSNEVLKLLFSLFINLASQNPVNLLNEAIMKSFLDVISFTLQNNTVSDIILYALRFFYILLRIYLPVDPKIFLNKGFENRVSQLPDNVQTNELKRLILVMLDLMGKGSENLLQPFKSDLIVKVTFTN